MVVGSILGGNAFDWFLILYKVFLYLFFFFFVWSEQCVEPGVHDLIALISTYNGSLHCSCTTTIYPEWITIHQPTINENKIPFFSSQIHLCLYSCFTSCSFSVIPSYRYIEDYIHTRPILTRRSYSSYYAFEIENSRHQELTNFFFKLYILRCLNITQNLPII